MRFAVVSLGCPKNHVDTEFIIEILLQRGLSFVPDSFDAQLVIINTCAFIEPAREEAVDTILSYGALKREKPYLKLAVCGCLVQLYGKSIAAEFPEVDFWLTDPQDNDGIDEMLRSLPDDGREKTFPVAGGSESSSLGSVQQSGIRADFAIARSRSILISEPGSAYLKIAEGCDNRCSYCSIPRIKGGLQSREQDSLIREASYLADRNIRELVLVAQDLTSYGSDRGGTELVKLVQRLLELPFRWIRLMYLYPMRIPGELLGLMAREKRICPYLDIPFQHADSTVLKAMGREGDPDVFIDYVEMLRETIPGLVLRTSLIVGHPAEGRTEFRRLEKFVGEACFEWLGVFPYSPEEGTASYELRPRPRFSTALKRAGIIDEIYRSVRRTDAFSPGREKDALVIDELDDILVCRSETEAPQVDGVILVKKTEGFPGAEPGSIVRVRILEEDALDFLAEPVRKDSNEC